MQLHEVGELDFIILNIWLSHHALNTLLANNLKVVYFIESKERGKRTPLWRL